MTPDRWVYIIVFVGAAAIPALLWVHRKIKQSGRDEAHAQMRDEFILDLATNHLPHIEAALKAIATHVGIEIPEPPPIRFFFQDK